MQIRIQGRAGRLGFETVFNADISPDGQQVVYTSCNHRSDDPIPALDGSIYEEGTPAWRERSHLNYELAVVDIDGGEPRRLTNDTRFDHFPAWSPDGSRIAFMSAPADRNPIEYYELQIYMTTPSGEGLQDGDLSYGYVKLGPIGMVAGRRAPCIFGWCAGVLRHDGEYQRIPSGRAFPIKPR